MISWFAVHTQPNRELIASQHLQRQGFDVFLPRYLKKRRHARKTEWVVAPLFPRYLFVGVMREVARWRAIRSTVGVSDLVQFGADPAEVPSTFVESLQSNLNEDGLVPLSQKLSPVPGDKLHILSGAFNNSIGILEKLEASDRVTLLLDLMGRQVRVKTSLENVHPAV